MTELIGGDTIAIANVTSGGTGLYDANPGWDTGDLLHVYRLAVERASGTTADTDQEEQIQKRKGRYRSGRYRSGRADTDQEEQMLTSDSFRGG